MTEHQMIELVKKINPFNANATKVALSFMQWRASKQSPRKFGDKITVDVRTSPPRQPVGARWRVLRVGCCSVARNRAERIQPPSLARRGAVSAGSDPEAPG